MHYTNTTEQSISHTSIQGSG